MPRTFEAPPEATTRPLRPIPVPGVVRYGLMNARGEYFTHAYLRGGRWHEWSPEPLDAHQWVSIDRCADAAKVWLATHGEPLTVVLL